MVSKTWTTEEEGLTNRLEELARDIKENKDIAPSTRARLSDKVVPLVDKLEEMSLINETLCTDLERIDQRMEEDPTREKELRSVYKRCMLKAAQGYHDIAESCSEDALKEEEISMTVNKFKIIMDVETNLNQDELVRLLDEKLSELVHDVYKADEGSDVVSLAAGVEHIALTGQKSGAPVA